MKMTAAVVHEKGGIFSYEEVDLQEPKENEILVRMVASGICGTDEGARQGELPISFPTVLGHEGAGVVEKVGALVKEFEVGDHVAFSYAFCDCCPACQSGQYTHCENYIPINFGGTATDGTTRLSQNGKELTMFFGQSSFATYAVVSQRSAVKIDKDIDLGLVAPMGCGIQTGAGTVLNTLKPSVSDSIAVYGMGSVGLSAIMAAKVANCKIIIGVGGNEDSLELAKELGATHTINRKKTDNLVEEIKKITDGKGVKFAIDTSGYGPMIQQGIKALSWQGIMATLAPQGKIENFDIGNDVLMQMRTIRGVNEGDSVAKVFIPELLALYKKGLFPLDKIIQYYKFEEIEKAIEDSKSGKVIKAVIRISEQ